MKNMCWCGRWMCMLFFPMVSSLLISCSNSTRNKTTNSKKSDYQDVLLQKPPGSFSDTITIAVSTAVFYNPDSLQLEKIKAITDAGILESTLHDCFYQMRNSRYVLRKNWPEIKIVEIANARFILFKHADGKNECIDLNKQNDPCGIFIFDGNKKARLVDMMNIESELGFYFSK